ncbi:uncharacterized protein [Haliotis cracherodii]|uniref:uncharacterized protein n=1 Tax=Haliotis cracherodii TaxID=6455 RepID=UPI0039EB16FB
MVFRKKFRNTLLLLIVAFAVYVGKYALTFNSLALVDTEKLTTRFNTTATTTFNKSHLIVFTSFPLMTDPKYKKSNLNKPLMIADRMKDFTESLNYTLQHQCVNEVHLFYDQDGMPKYINSVLGKQPKLIFDKVPNAYSYLSLFDIAHKNYTDKLVMITNGDIYPADGFEKLDYDHMKANRAFYVPSRRSRRERRCLVTRYTCDPKTYIGSHDSYIFIPDRKELPPKTKEYLTLKFDDAGIENIVITVYREILKYRVTNPCFILHIYHIHCSGLRHNDRIRPKYVKVGLARPTREL